MDHQCRFKTAAFCEVARGPTVRGRREGWLHVSFASQNIFFLSLTSVYLLLSGVEGYWLPMITLKYSRTLIGTPVDEGSTCRRDLYLTTHNTHNRQTSTPPAELEPAIPASDRPQIYSLVRAFIEIGSQRYTVLPPAASLARGWFHPGQVSSK